MHEHTDCDLPAEVATIPPAATADGEVTPASSSMTTVAAGASNLMRGQR